MKHVFRRLAAVVAIAVSAGAAQAEMINFEQPVDSPNAPFAPFLTHDDVFLQGSYYFNTFSNAANAQFGDLVGAMVNGSDLSLCWGVVCPSNNPSTFYGALNDGAVAFGRMDGQSFAVKSFDASFIGGMGATLPPVAGLLRLQGFTSTGATLTQTYQLAGPNASGALGFGSYQTTGTFASTQFETVFAFGFTCNTGGTCNAFSTDRGQFALDNISVTAVPEPETTAMFGLGLLAVGAAVRRRRQSAKGSV
ncbi:MAG: NF038120 family PEP-CTERM protein [Pseudomonadota bacterium]